MAILRGIVNYVHRQAVSEGVLAYVFANAKRLEDEPAIPELVDGKQESGRVIQ